MSDGKITIKSESQRALMRAAGELTGRTLNYIETLIKPGISTKELDEAAEEFIRSHGAVPSFLNYEGFPASICTSVNDRIVHGIPSRHDRLSDGDIISVDCGALLNGFHGDAARTFLVGNVAPEVAKLVQVTKECFFKGLEQAVVGNHISDIGRAIQQHAESHGYGVVRELVGHGIGMNMHEAPEVPNYVIPHFGRGARLVPGMAIIYIVCALIVVFANIGSVPGVFASIFKGAFNPAAVTGGAAGISIKLAMTKGVGRGVFSNEAGLGSAPIAHAATSEKNPVKQGLYGIFEVFMDTIVICTLTSLVVLCSGAADGNYGNDALAGVPTAVAGFSSVFGDKAGSLILAVGLLLFATSTILGWALYGTRCAEFLFGSKIIRPYQIVFCLVVIAGAVADLTLVWDISDTLNGLMAIPNLIALLLLSPVVIKLTREHFKK